VGVALFLDLGSMYGPGKALRPQLSLSRLKVNAASGRPLGTVQAYYVAQNAGEAQAAQEALQRAGFRPVVRVLAPGEEGSLSVQIALDIAQVLGRVSTVVVASHDARLADAGRMVRAQGVRFEVMGFDGATPPGLVEIADAVHLLDGAVSTGG
jgi:hypothetical protein